MRKIAWIGILLATLTGCVSQKHAEPLGFTYAEFKDAKILPYDSPPQVIYSIDDHRFITLERYRDCDHGDTYYNDTKVSIRTYLGRGGIESYHGKLAIADPTGRNVVIPSSGPPHLVCGDRGCTVSVIYSMDGGRTFHGTRYMRSFDPSEDTKRYAILVTSDSYYVVRDPEKQKPYVTKYPLVPGYLYGQGEIPGGRDIEYAVKMPLGIRSPSGQDRFSCDASIRPTNPDASLN